MLGPSSVLILTGPEHMRQRKLLLPPFHGERMREYEQVIVQETRRDMEGWPRGRAMRMLPRTRAITLEVILRAVFGVQAQRMDSLRAAIAGLLEPMHTLTFLRAALSSPRAGRPDGRGRRSARSAGRGGLRAHRRAPRAGRDWRAARTSCGC